MSLRNIFRRGLITGSVSLRLDELALWLHRARRDGSDPRVLVVEMHETMARDAERFRRQLAWVVERFVLISPREFFNLWELRGRHGSNSKPAILFTFDDGRASNYNIAAPILESLGTRGLFFVVPDFIGLRGSEARDFYYSRIDVRGLPPAEDEEVWRPMSPEQVSDLTRRGHEVGNHTLSHVNLVGLSEQDLRTEVVSSAEKIATWTGKRPDAFAWPYSWDAISRPAWELITKNHRFCFSPCPGVVRRAADSPRLVWRTEVECYYRSAEYRFMYSGLASAFWSSKRQRLRGILGNQV